MSIYSKYVLVLLIAGLSMSSALAQNDLSVFDYWKFHEGSPSVSLYKHLYHRASDQLAKRQTTIAKLQTRADWQKRQSEVKAKLAEAVGAFPAKTPLNPVITGTLERDDFKVEKLYFESRPGYFVTAALFTPKGKTGPLPAILYCSGHTPNGFRSNIYQHTILNYVKKGFIVLAFDPIGQGERQQYREIKDKAAPTRDHSYSGTYTFVNGLSPANYFIWDGIRAIDYLITRPEVDASRIGITGRSGGGTQTAYIAAIDNRIVAAAPECFITTTDKLWQANGPQDAEQNLVHFVAKGLDLPDLIEIRAPKPTLIVSTTRDMFPIQGVRDTYNEAKAAFGAFGKTDYLSKVEDDAPHASTPKNREATYAFFQKYLTNPGSAEDLKVDIFNEEDLFVTPTGNIFSDLKSESLFSLNQKYTRDLVQKEAGQKRKPLNINTLRTLAMTLSGYEAPPTRRDIVFSGKLQRTGYAIEKYLVRGVGEYYMPVLWLKPEQPIGKALLFLDERGKAEALKKEEWIEQLVRQGYEVVMPDLSGCGELGPGYMKGGDAVLDNVPLNVWYAGIQTNKSLVAIRAEEIGILTDFIKKTSGSSASLSAAAYGTLTSDLLHAALFANPFEQTVLLNPLVSYLSMTEVEEYKPKFALSTVAGALTRYDLPDMVATLSSNRLLLVNPVDAGETELTPDQVASVYKKSRLPLSSTESFIRYSVKPRDLFTIFHTWLK
jgi:dienelactone hydrolase